MLLQIAAKAADAISAGDVVNRKVIHLFQVYDLDCRPKSSPFMSEYAMEGLSRLQQLC